MTSYLQIDKLTKSFGVLVLFEDISFGIAQGQKIGLIARNGSGKTTLLNIIAGKEDYDSGSVVFRNDLRVGYLEQTPHFPEGLTVLQACFYSPNETVKVIAEYERAVADNDHVDRKVLEYSPSEGIRSFREKLVEYYAKFNINVDVDDIIITTGGSEAVFFSFMACLDPGDEIIVPEPAYANYMAFAISSGAVIKTIASTIDEGFALPSVERFEELITPRTKAILICNPNNPTGYLYTQKEMDQIRDIVKKYDLFLFSDEVYREFCYTGAPYISAFHLKGIENNVVLVDSVSKRYSECGIRIGALITKNKMVKENVMKWCQARLSPPLIGQIIAEASLDTSNEYMLEVYNEYVERRKFLIDGLNRIQGCYSPIPMGAFYTLAKLPVDDADKFCA